MDLELFENPYEINNNSFYGEFHDAWKCWCANKKFNDYQHVWYIPKGYRYVRIPSSYPGHDDDMYYYYHDKDGYASLVLTNKFATQNASRLRSALRNATVKNSRVSWESQYRCYYCAPVRSMNDLIQAFNFLREIFNPVVDNYLSTVKATAKQQRSLNLSLKGNKLKEHIVEKNKPELKTFHTKDLPFDEFRMPPYQRTYKWQPKQVFQLMSDIIQFTQKGRQYRLGTIVLNNSDIVDGQQRLVTLALIFAELQEIPEVSEQIMNDNSLRDFFKSINGFLDRTEYDLPEAKTNIARNVLAIRERKEDLTCDFLKSLMYYCSFTVVFLPTVPEAFQFFDSQNARGKDLAPHDLLKAYHLREVGTENDIKKENVELLIDEWQEEDTDMLVKLFLCLYRIRMWSRGKSARYFLKENVDAFKGLNLKSKQIFNCYKPSQLLTLFLRELSSEKSSTQFPFQIDGVIINGKSFFEQILHYMKLYEDIKNPKSFGKPGSRAYDILSTINDYSQKYRMGDIYARQLFDALLLYYCDRFGNVNIDKAVEKIFAYAYGIRLKYPRVYLATIDNEAICENSLFQIIRDATRPEDILNSEVELIKPEAKCNAKLLSIYESIKYLGDDEQLF